MGIAFKTKTDVVREQLREDIIDGKLRITNYKLERTETIDIDEISSVFDGSSKIYSNGFSEIYKTYK